MKLFGKTQGAGDLELDRPDPAYRSFIDAHHALYGLDCKGFCRPTAAADEMFFKAILPNYKHGKEVAAFK